MSIESIPISLSYLLILSQTRKMQFFFNDDLIYWRKKLSKSTWPYVKK